MISRLALAAAVASGFAGPALAGACTQRIADVEKSLTAKQEGGGPALQADANADGTRRVPAVRDAPTTGSTSAGQGTNVTAQSQDLNQAMQMIQQAKSLDQQGKESECMDAANRAGALAPAGVP